MHYALLIYDNEAHYGAAKDNAAMQDLVSKHMTFAQELGSKRIGGAGLKGTATATTVRRNAEASTIHDGPFAETKEQLGGFYIVDAVDLDEAIGIAKKIPLAQAASIEIRPLLGG